MVGHLRNPWVHLCMGRLLVSTAPSTPHAIPPLDVRAVVGTAAIAPGASLDVVVIARNTSGATRTVQAGSSCFTEAEVLGAHDRVLAAGGRMCAQRVTTRTLAPGEAIEERITVELGTSTTPLLPPGRHRVRGVLVLLDGSHAGPPVPFEVRAP